MLLVGYDSAIDYWRYVSCCENVQEAKGFKKLIKASQIAKITGKRIRPPKDFMQKHRDLRLWVDEFFKPDMSGGVQGSAMRK